MLQAKDLGPKERIYSFVGDDGKNTYIAAERLRQHCELVQPERFLVPINRNLGLSFIRDNVVAPARVKALTLADLQSPVIFCHDGTFTHGRPDMLLVDGHHRYCRAALENRELILGWVLEEQFWRPFQIDGMPKISQEQLSAQPIAKRDYW